MTAPITRVAPDFALLKKTGFDSIIDVRSPSEFLDDHVPGAINLPVLDDAQRAEIGTIYKQINPFEAKRLGAALVAQNIAGHLQTDLAKKDRDWRPLIYCWRGGQRSGAMAKIFSDIGWHSAVIEGGYKSYRKAVLDDLDHLPAKFRLIVLSGPTGTAKTHILRLYNFRVWNAPTDAKIERGLLRRISRFRGLLRRTPQTSTIVSKSTANHRMYPNRPKR